MMNIIESFLNSHKRGCFANRGEDCTCGLFLARAELKRLTKSEEIGNLSSNVFFNWSQQDRFTPDERKLMKDLQTQWDALAATENP